MKLENMLIKKEWSEFKEAGFLWFINRTLHIFGWAIVLEYDKENSIISVYPARTKFRGFDNATNSEGYKKITEYMDNNSVELLKEVE